MIGKRRLNISPNRWAEMLRTAGAPEPWADPDAPRKFAEIIRNRTLPEPKPEQTTRKTVQLAVAKLRPLTLEMVRAYERTITVTSTVSAGIVRITGWLGRDI